MRDHVKRACAATVAAAAAMALTAGMTGPAAARQDGDGPLRPGTNSNSTRDSNSTRSDAFAPRTTTHRLTLLTGDHVTVDPQGRVTGFAPAKGRERVPVRTLRSPGGHTLVLPADAQRLISEGRIDQRFFDVTELSEKRNRAAQAKAKGLKLIVGYKGSAAHARAGLRATGDTTVRRTLKSLNADAVTTPKQDAADLWKTLTDGVGGKGIEHVWLDGTREATLDKSVRQIGADKAWDAGYDGKGVRIAVLDSGVDTTHPDLHGQVVAEKNFSASPDLKDRVGHGTHVASTAAGTGAKSGGKFKGVAPGAELISGKVLDDDGFGDDSGIVAGMEWAAAEGADVVNLSLGGGDSPDVDPLEAAVNKLSEENGILFAVSAGNDGRPGSVGSPGTADAALTVGAVDDNDKLAPFSSRGPRAGDGGIKPDVTAPGVDITAAAAPGSAIEKQVGQNPEGYLSISGTSMASPHVAGAAALLKQQHPKWTYAELKGALTASTKDGGYRPFQQGSGRIAVDRAIGQTVIAEPVSVNFGIQAWPHTDDEPLTKKVTYRNLGTDDVSLDLSMAAAGPEGDPAPAGFFSLGAEKVTVPAGGTASVELTADSKLGGTVDGTYSAYVMANGGGQSVRTAAVVEREIERYDVTLKFIGRDGRPASNHASSLSAITGADKGLNLFPDSSSATFKARLAKGSYLLDAAIYVDPENGDKGVDWLAGPALVVDKDTTVTVDARKTKPVDITGPDPSAELVSMDGRYSYAGYELGALRVTAFQHMRTAHLGPQAPDGLGQQWLGTWLKGADTRYDMVIGGPVKKLATGYTRHLKPADFATLKVGTGASSPGRSGSLFVAGYQPQAGGISPILTPQPLPRTKTVHVSALDGTRWGIDFSQYGDKDADGDPVLEGSYSMPPETYKAGGTYARTFNTGVFGPALGKDLGLFREGDRIGGRLPVAADGKGHPGWSAYASAKSTLYRDGTKIAENDDPVSGSETFRVPADEAEYRLTTSVTRDPRTAAASSRIDASWTFRSKNTGTEKVRLPASTVRFAPKLDLSSRAPAGATQSVPVKVQGSAAGPGNLKSLAVYVSYDDGRTWQKTPVRDGRISVRNPAKGEGIAFRATVTDKDGNKSTLSVHDAYHGK
ncbi:S8 family serine peptidase [Streptomyces sp. NPDC058284]|uniref:S8 family peptidase n=1 Tax=unclassified Streptomyces TaxID=2593676 RepID=UPI0036472992